MPADAAEKGDRPLAPGLYLVATPIGNLEDMTLRGLRVLRGADRIACEDTRQTQKLLNHFDIHTPTVSYHAHNEQTRAAELVGELRGGGRIAVVSDAGTPGIADPGGQLVLAAIEAGVPVFPVPGANAAISALIASGLPTETFTFHGFLPAKHGERLSALEAVGQNATAATHVFFEAPHRILDALGDVATAFGGEKQVVVARELTKLHEEFLRGTAEEVRRRLAERAQVRGEMVLMLETKGGQGEETAGGASVREAVMLLVASEGVSEMEALKRVAKARGVGKSELYREWQRAGKRH